MSEPEAPPTPGVGVRTVTLGGLPLLVAGVPDHGPGARLLDAVGAAGLTVLSGVIGVELPRGADVGFVLDVRELRLVDAQDAALLRAPRDGIDADWLDAARRLRGTMTVLVRDLVVPAEGSVAELVTTVDGAARDGRALGAIVGVAEARPQLPLLLG